MDSGTRLGQYEILDQLGAGGMGEVYRARDTTLDRDVAIKVISADVADDEQRKARFTREAKALAALNHPSIATIYGLEEAGDVRFIVMELVEGESLQERLRRGPLPVAEALAISRQVAVALEAAHRAGIVHRDIKPANVVVTATGEAKVLDFGIAKQIVEPNVSGATTLPTELTGSGVILGTAPYMSPEQVRGGTIDKRSDIWSFGCLLYELLMARGPFVRETVADTLSSILEAEPALGTLPSDVPGRARDLIARCLRKDPAERLPDMADARIALDALLAEQTAGRERRRSGSRLAFATTASVVVVAGVLAVWWTQRDVVPGDAGRSDVGAAQILSSGPSIAVLPFINASGDPEQKYFSDGLTVDIITELAHYRELSVLARISMPAEGSDIDVRELAASLGARYILQGSVRTDGRSLRVNVQLSDSGDGRLVWGTTYDRDLTAVALFDLQDELTQQVVNAIAGSYGALTRARLPDARRKAPASLDSYDCVVRVYEYLQVHTGENHLASRDCLERVIAVEPEYADGRAWLAYLYAEEYHHRRNERLDEYVALDRALENAEAAVQLDTANHLAHGVLAKTHLYRGEYERFKIEALLTVELSPNDALWLLMLGSDLVYQEDFENGLPMVAKALALSSSPPSWGRMGFFIDDYQQGRYEEALEEAMALGMEEDFRGPLLVAAAAGQLGRAHEARQALDELRARWKRPIAEIRRELIERHGISPAITDHLLEGLAKAGLEGVDPVGTSNE